MPVRTGVGAWQCVLVGFAVSACGGEGAKPSWTPADAPILFGATRAGRVDLWVAFPEGVERRVVAGDASEVAPRVGPDGVRMLFHARDEGRPYRLFLATPEGTEALVDEPGVHAIGGVWSPDGVAVAYFSDRGVPASQAGGLPGHVWIRDLATGVDRRLTVDPLPGTVGPSDWSPDGRWILAARPFDGQLDVVRVEVATGVEERLTHDPAAEYGAAFSHDGRYIAFHVETGDASQVAILELETGVRRRVTDGPGWRYSPVWSPDDAWLLVNSAPDGGQVDLVAVRVADGAVEPLVVTPEDERYGVWIPPGSPWGRR